MGLLGKILRPKPDSLWQAAKAGDSDKVRSLLQKYPELVFGRCEGTRLTPVSEWEYVGWTPLHFAASLGHREIVELLLASAADPNAKDASPRGHGTPMLAATFTVSLLAKAGKPIETAVAIIEALVLSGADVNALGVKPSWTPLADAGRNLGEAGIPIDYLKSAFTLVFKGPASSNINPFEVLPGTPLSLAMALRDDKLADFLRRHGGQE